MRTTSPGLTTTVSFQPFSESRGGSGLPISPAFCRNSLDLPEAGSLPP